VKEVSSRLQSALVIDPISGVAHALSHHLTFLQVQDNCLCGLKSKKQEEYVDQNIARTYSRGHEIGYWFTTTIVYN
jgi:hypothetical protein